MGLPEYSIAELEDKFDSGELTAVKLCEAFLQRIAEVDHAGPTLRAVIELNPEALEIASSLDRERQKKGPRSPLHGVPVLVKDSLDTADKMMTTAGSLALEGGWSSRGGQVRNPYMLDRSPSGSSSGSAVAVAANLCTVAIGAEVDGSIVRPASTNGIVGLKPTVGLVSRAGIIPVASPQDTAGPMARTVSDVATVLTALTGYDPRDPVTQESVGRGAKDYRTFLKANGLKGVRLGVARNYFGSHEGTDAIIEKAIDHLKALGAEIIDPVTVSSIKLFDKSEIELFLYEFKAGLNRYLAEHPKAKVRTLEELIHFNRTHAERMMPYFQQELLEMAQAKGDLSEDAYLEAKSECRRLSRTDGIDKAMREHGLDAIIAPTDGTPAWVIDPIVGDKILAGCPSPAAMAGYPHITVPAGYVHGLPVGLSFFAGAYQEGNLIRYAFAYELATQVRQPPGFKATLET